MLQWNEVTPVTIFGMTVKMYREPFQADETLTVENLNIELDHYAFKFLGTESEMYKILDVNFEEYFEERGDLFRLSSVKIPVTEKV